MMSKFKPHHSAQDAAYCYTCDAFVCLLVTSVSLAKRLNQSRCNLRCGFQGAQGTMPVSFGRESHTGKVAFFWGGGIILIGWLCSRVVSVLDSGAEEPRFKSQSRRCRVTVLSKLLTPIVPLFTKQQNW